jgi:regulator of protease activity HflC (stomatin/prohibitin superfamily)
MLAKRDKMNNDSQEIIDMRADAWGIKVLNVKIKHIDLNESMIRAIARQAEAKREQWAEVINAEGEFVASEKLLSAAEAVSRTPQALQLRYLRTLADISTKNTSNTIIFPIPMEMMTSLMKSATGGKGEQAES